MNPTIAFALLWAVPAYAADFSTRVAAAELAFASAGSEGYIATFFPQFTDAMSACHPSGPAAKIEQLSFSFVADVAPDGSLRSVDVQPKTNYALCFADYLNTQKFRPPPKTSLVEGYPIYIEIGSKP